MPLNAQLSAVGLADLGLHRVFCGSTCFTLQTGAGTCQNPMLYLHVCTKYPAKGLPFFFSISLKKLGVAFNKMPFP